MIGNPIKEPNQAREPEGPGTGTDGAGEFWSCDHENSQPPSHAGSTGTHP